eukprot:Colp12_sorted_trinity150504_noHs@18781
MSPKQGFEQVSQDSLCSVQLHASDDEERETEVGEGIHLPRVRFGKKDYVHLVEANNDCEGGYGYEVQEYKITQRNGRKTSTQEVLGSSWTLVSYHDLPEWYQDNDFIHHHYRPELNCVKACTKSLLCLHTETINIWTHLLGAIGAIGLLVYAFQVRLHSYPWQDQLVFAVYIFSGMLCWLFSAIFHTFIPHSQRVFKIVSRLDYTGISVLCTGSFVPMAYYTFYCHPTHRLVYMIICTTLGVLTSLASLWDKIDQARYRNLRTAMYVSLGLSGIVPIVHGVILHGLELAQASAAVGWLALMGASYISGSLLYVARIPERFAPGKFDLFGHSHQIFHVLCLVGFILHYYGMMTAAEWRIVHLCNFEPPQNLT